MQFQESDTRGDHHSMLSQATRDECSVPDWCSFTMFQVQNDNSNLSLRDYDYRTD